EYRRVRVITAAETIEKLVGEREPVDAAMRELIGRLDQIAAKVSQHPLQTLRAELSLVTINEGRSVMATLTLSNRGTQPAVCRNPLVMTNAPDAHLTIEAWPDKPPSELRAEDQVSAGVQGVEMTGRPAGAQAPPAVVEIPPHGSAPFRIYAVLPLKGAGPYAVRALYMNTAGRAGDRPLIVGEVYSKTVTAVAP
ncbi:MAG: hypothetical protein ACRD68_03750, partial [Pyrinomonadaceae bacterium]